MLNPIKFNPLYCNCYNVSTHSRCSSVPLSEHAGSFLFPSPCLMYCNIFCKCKPSTSIYCTSFTHTLLIIQFEYNKGHSVFCFEVHALSSRRGLHYLLSCGTNKMLQCKFPLSMKFLPISNVKYEWMKTECVCIVLFKNKSCTTACIASRRAWENGRHTWSETTLREIWDIQMRPLEVWEIFIYSP
jgi:hypothetical protein